MSMDSSHVPENLAFPSSPDPRPCSSVYSDEFSLEDLAQRVDESIWVTQLSSIQRLLEENSALEKDLTRYRQTWHDLMALFDEVFELALLLRGSIDEFRDKITAAESKWLATYGVGGSSEIDNWI